MSRDEVLISAELILQHESKLPDRFRMVLLGYAPTLWDERVAQVEKVGRAFNQWLKRVGLDFQIKRRHSFQSSSRYDMLRMEWLFQPLTRIQQRQARLKKLEDGLALLLDGQVGMTRRTSVDRCWHWPAPARLSKLVEEVDYALEDAGTFIKK